MKSLLTFLLITLPILNLYSAETVHFPKNFKWCVATAAHQIEGGNENNDWWEWENLFPSKIKNGDRSELATDHWNRIPEDTKLLNDLGVQQYRFSIEWSRIETSEGVFNQEAINHYKMELAELKKYGIAPMVTLHHFTSPIWFSHQGGWANSHSPKQFLSFVKYVRQQLGESVQFWITFNEPMVMIGGGYIDGIFPPGIKDWNKAVAPLRNILLAHAMAYKELHKNTDAMVGIAHHLRVMDPFNKLNPVDWYLAQKLSNAFNWAFVDALKDGKISLTIPTIIKYKEVLPELKDTQDFIGVNYYSRDLIQFTPKKNPAVTIKVNDKNSISDLGWEIYPQGIYAILKTIHKKFPNLPIFITENGIADQNDSKRSDFLIQHLKYVHQAIADGINVQGYCHWSLIDNFEWAQGFDPRFGLYEVDYKTFKRTPRKSALLYQKIISKNALTF